MSLYTTFFAPFFSFFPISLPYLFLSLGTSESELECDRQTSKFEPPGPGDGSTRPLCDSHHPTPRTPAHTHTCVPMVSTPSPCPLAPPHTRKKFSAPLSPLSPLLPSLSLLLSATPATWQLRIKCNGRCAAARNGRARTYSIWFANCFRQCNKCAAGAGAHPARHTCIVTKSTREERGERERAAIAP